MTEQSLLHNHSSYEFQKNIEAIYTIPQQEADFIPFPDYFPSLLIDFFESRGIHALYSHQFKAFEESSLIISKCVGAVMYDDVLRKIDSDPEWLACISVQLAYNIYIYINKK